MNAYSDYETIKLTANNLASNDIVGTDEETVYKDMVVNLKRYSKIHSDFLNGIDFETLEGLIKTANKDYTKLQTQATEVANSFQNADNYTSDQSTSSSNGQSGSHFGGSSLNNLPGSTGNNSSNEKANEQNKAQSSNDSSDNSNKAKSGKTNGQNEVDSDIVSGIATIGGVSSIAGIGNGLSNETNKYVEKILQEQQEAERKKQEQILLEQEEYEREQKKLEEQKYEENEQEKERQRLELEEKNRLQEEQERKKQEQQEAEQLQMTSDETNHSTDNKTQEQLEYERLQQEQNEKLQREKDASNLQASSTNNKDNDNSTNGENSNNGNSASSKNQNNSNNTNGSNVAGSYGNAYGSSNNADYNYNANANDRSNMSSSDINFGNETTKNSSQDFLENLHSGGTDVKKAFGLGSSSSSNSLNNKDLLNNKDASFSVSDNLSNGAGSDGSLLAGNSFTAKNSSLELNKDQTLKSGLSIGLGLLAAATAGATTKKVLDNEENKKIKLEDNISLQGNLQIDSNDKKDEYLDEY